MNLSEQAIASSISAEPERQQRPDDHAGHGPQRAQRPCKWHADDDGRAFLSVADSTTRPARQSETADRDMRGRRGGCPSGRGPAAISRRRTPHFRRYRANAGLLRLSFDLVEPGLGLGLGGCVPFLASIGGPERIEILRLGLWRGTGRLRAEQEIEPRRLRGLHRGTAGADFGGDLVQPNERVFPRFSFRSTARKGNPPTWLRHPLRASASSRYRPAC